MKAINYHRLNEIRRFQKPYRGSTNRFPIGDRRHNTKCFYVTERNGEEVFEIAYGYDYSRVEHTKEDHEKDPDRIYAHLKADGNDKDEYYRYAKSPHIIGIVRPDNTFEFTCETSTGQGANSVLSTWSMGIFCRSVRHGGMVYREGWRESINRFHPVFKGLRLNLHDMSVHESCDYKVITRRVHRGKAKEYLKQYENFFKTSETMVKVMEGKDIKEIALELLQEVDFKSDRYWYVDNETREKLYSYGESYMKDRPVDAVLMFSMAYDINNLYRIVGGTLGGHGYYVNNAVDPEYLYANFRRRLGKELYSKNPDVFTEVEYQANEPYPASVWGVTVICNGKEVQQY